MTRYELHEAISCHEQWCENLSRTLICTRVPDRRDLQDDAHRRCRFGRWLYGAGVRSIGHYASFSRIEAAHELLHRQAGKLLALSAAGGSIALDEYERFSATLKQMRVEVAATKRELESEIFNLDPLTGAPNRIGMLTQMRKQHGLVNRKAQLTCIAMIDLDHFKEVNDNYGHAAGDQVLRYFARHMMSRLRRHELVLSLWRRRIPVLRAQHRHRTRAGDGGAAAPRGRRNGDHGSGPSADQGDRLFRSGATRRRRPCRTIDRARRQGALRR